jgi:phosphatidylglycerol:prolipoprotein diacylglycerol transferase
MRITPPRLPLMPRIADTDEEGPPAQPLPEGSPVSALLAIEIYIDPTITQVGRFLLTWHGVFTAIGIVTAVFVTAMFARRRGIVEDDVYNIALWAIPGGIIGARLLFVLENFDQFRHNLLDIISINEGGISIYGALIGGAVAAWGYAWWKKLQMRVISDAAAFGLLAGQAIGRMGDFINGEHLARSTGLPWGFCYTHPETLQTPICGPGVAGGAPVHPVAGAYEPLLLLALFWALLYLRRVIARDGVIFWLYVLGYAAIRFSLSPLRTNESSWGPLSVPQWIALAMVVLAVAALRYIRRLPEKSPRPQPRPQVRRPTRTARTGTR